VFRQIYLAEGPSGPNKEYLFKLEDALNKLGEVPKVLLFYRILRTIEQSEAWASKFKYLMTGVVDPHVQELANAVREYSDAKLSE
jgi:cation transport protein ChaC